MASWRPAKSLETLRSQINAFAPNRSKVSDGVVGDAAHAKGKSGHNPNAAGVVVAMDVTHDPANGMDCQSLADTLVASRDNRLQYLIFNGRIINSEVQPWLWRKYTGKNQHTQHIHIEVKTTPALYDDPRPWSAVSVPAPPVAPVRAQERPTSPPPLVNDAPAPETAGDPERPLTGLAAFLVWFFSFEWLKAGKK